MKALVLVVGLSAVLGLPSLASACSCCAPPPATSTAQEGHGVAAKPDASASKSAVPLSAVTKVTFETYSRIQNALARDSFEGVSNNAAALARAVREDGAGEIPMQVATEAEALSKTKDLAAARSAFKPLSQSLIQYARANQITPGAYVEVYCSMTKAGWLQTGKGIKNPYFGSSMFACGQVKSAR